ncbi:MAG: PAAR-like protein [Fusobacteriaceae bacterium]
MTVYDILEKLKNKLNPYGEKLVLLSEERELLKKEEKQKINELIKIQYEYHVFSYNNNLYLNPNAVYGFDIFEKKRIFYEKINQLNKERKIIEKKITEVNKKEEKLRMLYKEVVIKDSEISTIEPQVDEEKIKLMLSIIPRRKKPVYMPKPVFNKLKNKTIEMFQEGNQAIFFFYSEDDNKKDGKYIENKGYLSEWKLIDSEEEINSSFQATAFSKRDDIIVAYRGTEFFEDYDINHFIKDLLADKKLYLDIRETEQRKLAHKFLEKIKNDPKNKNKKIHVVGHSLGGALANYAVVDLKNLENIKSLVTFNSLGIIHNNLYNETWDLKLFKDVEARYRLRGKERPKLEEVIIDQDGALQQFEEWAKYDELENERKSRDLIISKLQSIVTKNYVLVDDTVPKLKENVGKLVVDKDERNKGKSSKSNFNLFKDAKLQYHSLYSFLIYLNDEGNFQNNEVNKGLKSKKLENKIKEIHVINAIKSSLEEKYGKGALILEAELNSNCTELEEMKKYLNEKISDSVKHYYKNKRENKDNFKLLIKEQIEKLEKEGYYFIHREEDNENTYKIKIGKYNNYESVLGIKGNYPIILTWSRNKEIRATGLPVLDGATLKCDKGSKLSEFKVTNQNKIYIEGKLQGTQKDCVGKKNIGDFGVCLVDQIAPKPCVSLISTTEWQETSKKKICDAKIILESSYCKCSIGGKITVDASLCQKINCD